MNFPKFVLLCLFLWFGGLFSTTQGQTCLNFQDTNLSQLVNSSQTTYGSAVYVSQGISFRVRYLDYIGVLDPGSITIGDHVTAGYTGGNGNTNYAGNILYQGNAVTEANITGAATGNKTVTFDVNYINSSTAANPYNINGAGTATLPAGITYSATPLTNGFQITLTGPINTIEWIGHEVAVDNLCVQGQTVAPPGPGCTDFESTTLSQAVPTSQSAYGPTWFTDNGINYRSRYVDYTLTMTPGSVTIADHVGAGYTGSNGNSNYSGNIFYQGNAVTELDFSGLPFANRKIEFDVNYIDSQGQNNPYRTNGQGTSTLPTGVTYSATPLTNGFHIELTGAISTIEFHGHEIAVDNLCVDSATTPPPPPPPPAGCIDFQDNTLSVGLNSSQTTYGTVYYSSNGITFQSRYVDYLGFGDPGSVTIGDHATAGYTGSNGNTNFAGNILYQGNAVTQIDLSGFGSNGKTIEFDVNYIDNSTAANPFRINGQVVSNLPAGVSYTATPLVNGFHVVLSGAIQTFELHGFEAAMDNLCVQALVVTPNTPLNGAQLVLAPNQVGSPASIAIPAQAQVFDRNGLVVLQPSQNLSWTGLDDSNRPLPMGAYTVVCANGDVFQVTILR